MNDAVSDEQKSKRKLYLLSAIPISLNVVLAFSFNPKNIDSFLGVVFYGIILTCLSYPIYYMILCWYHTIRKKHDYGACVTICLVMNALANTALLVIVGISSFFAKNLFTIFYVLLLFLFSMSLTGACLFIVMLIKRRYDKKNVRN